MLQFFVSLKHTIIDVPQIYSVRHGNKCKQNVSYIYVIALENGSLFWFIYIKKDTRSSIGRIVKLDFENVHVRT